MRISNETKVGALSAVAITLLILGFNFLKGRNLLSKSRHIYAKYANVYGLVPSNQVIVNGLQIGTVSSMEPMDKDVHTILVVLNINKDVNIPDNSEAFIKAIPLGTPEVDLELGNSPTSLENGDTIRTKVTPGIMDDVLKTINPVLAKVMNTLDTTVALISSLLDPNTQGNLRATIANLQVTTVKINRLMDQESAVLSRTLQNVESITENLKDNNGVLSETFQNLRDATAQVAHADIGRTLARLDSTTRSLNDIIARMNSTNGTLGALINDKRLYNNLNSTTRSLNTLLDDLRLHPKRYVSFSVFGKKDNAKPLSAPADSTH